MKKLTAGIFASILGLTAIGAADAAVPSTKYVDDAVKAVAGDVSELNTTVQGHTTQIADLQGADATLQGNIDTLSGTVAGKANTADLKQVAFTADYNDLLNVPAGQAPLTETQLQAVNSGITADKVVAYDAVAADYVTEAEAQGYANAKDTAISAAQTTANEAAAAAAAADTKAGNAQTTANEAVAAASAADTKAGNAQTTANEAAAAAAAADTKAGNAQTAASEAAAAASAADTKAGNAQTAASEAAAAASAADTKAGNAQTTANEAKAAAAANATAIEGKLSTDDAAATYELKANVSGAPNDTETGKYVLTKIVTQGEGGVEVVSYGWELIDREYSAQ